MTGTQVDALDGYLNLIGHRLQNEGFAVSRSGRLGDLPLALVATRTGGGLRDSTTIHFVVSADVAGQGTRGLEPVTPEAIIPFSIAALDAHAADRGALAANVLVVPVAIARVGASPRLDGVLSSLQLKRGNVTVLPAVVDLLASTVHLLRRAEDLDRGQRDRLPYLWWLLSPQLVERPRTAVAWTPLRRILLGSMVGTLALFAGLYVKIMREPAARHYLTFKADPSTHRIAYMRHGARLVDASLVVIGADGRELSRTPIDPSAFLIGYAGNEITTQRCDPQRGRCTFYRQAATATSSTVVAQAPGPVYSPGVLSDGTIVYSDRMDHDAQSWSIKDGRSEPLSALEHGDRSVGSVASDGRLVVAAGMEGRTGLVVVDPATRERHELTPAGGGDAEAAPSPSGSRVAFYRGSRRAYGERQGRDVSQVWDLELVDTAGGTPTLLIQDVCPVSPPGWLDDSTVVYGKWTGERCDVFTYDLLAKQTRQLVDHY